MRVVMKLQFYNLTRKGRSPIMNYDRAWRGCKSDPRWCHRVQGNEKQICWEREIWWDEFLKWLKSCTSCLIGMALSIRGWQAQKLHSKCSEKSFGKAIGLCSQIISWVRWLAGEQGDVRSPIRHVLKWFILKPRLTKCKTGVDSLAFNTSCLCWYYEWWLARDVCSWIFMLAFYVL